MTEEEWKDSTDPGRALRFLLERVSERKRRLFACACCGLVRHLIVDDRSWAAVLAAERYVDGLVTAEKLDTLAGDANTVYLDMDDTVRRRAAEAAFRSAVTWDDELWQMDLAWADAALALEGHALETSAGLNPADTREMLESWCEAWGGSGRTMGWTDADPDARMMELLRCIVGNPFRPVAFDPAWPTSTVTGLARGIYDDRAFDRLPILADALQDAGCENPDVLDHCRGPEPHARGCWVVDAVLGKS